MMIGVRDIGKVGVLAFALSTSGAFADMSEGKTKSAAVPYAELDLSKSAGAEVLYEFTLSSLGSIATAGCLVITTTVGSGVDAEVPDASLLVPLQVIEPARWLVENPGIERWEEDSVRVAYSELDLSNAAGVSELYKRLRRASEKVCGLSKRAQFGSSPEKNLCVSGVLAKTVAEVNLRSLDKEHSG